VPVTQGEKMLRSVVYMPHTLRMQIEKEAARRGLTLSSYLRQLASQELRRERGEAA
jgi:hypothetical protein